ncbi:hypothetical protein [Streptomyces canus]|uniref:hypothetical protein n=1 Tax=Streptomyces canus TaxID=58343 RepID=UPI0027D7B827|nr:hypothetical protein [Streptomyces canus]
MGAKHDDEVRVVLANVKNDGGPETKRGVLPDRWRLAFELEPDIVAVTAFTYSQTRPGATWAERRAANRRFKAGASCLAALGTSGRTT